MTKSTKLRARRTSRHATILLAGFLGIAMVGCAAGNEAGDDSASAVLEVAGVEIEVNEELAATVPDDIASGGVLSSIQYDAIPADSFLDEQGNVVGWGPDLGAAVAQVLGLEYESEAASSFDTIIPGIENGRFDTSWASYLVTEERLEIVDIVTAHESSTGVVTQAGAGLTIDEGADLCGLRIGALAGSAFLIQMEELAAECESAGSEAPTIESFSQQAAAQLAVSSGRIDAFATARGQLTWILSDRGGAVEGFELQPLEYQVNPEGIVIRQDSGLTEPIAAALNLLIEDGSYEQIMQYWDVDFGLIDSADINPEP